MPSGTNIDYLIDGQNRRIGKKVNGALVEGFRYRNQLQPVVWLNGHGTVRATFVQFGNVLSDTAPGFQSFSLAADLETWIPAW